MHTHTQEDPLLYMRQWLPCPPLSQCCALKRSMSTKLVFPGRMAATQPLANSVKTCVLTEEQPCSQSLCTQLLPHSFSLWAASPHWGKQTVKAQFHLFTLRHAQREAGRGCRKKSSVCLNMPFKKCTGGNLLNGRPEGPCCTHWSSEAAAFRLLL